VNVVKLYLDKTQTNKANNSLSRNSGSQNLSQKRQKYSNYTNFSKSVNSFLFSMFNKSNDKSTDYTRVTSNKSNSNLPNINAKLKPNSLKKGPVKLVSNNKSLDTFLLGISSNILSPKSLDYYNTIKTQENETIDFDTFSQDNNTLENLETRNTNDSTLTLSKKIEPVINEVNKSKADSTELMDESAAIAINSPRVGNSNTNKVITNLKKITINLKDEKPDNIQEDFRIKLKRIETIKEENECEISKLNITLYPRYNSNPPCMLNLKTGEKINESAEDNSDFLKIRLNKQSSVNIRKTSKFNISKLMKLSDNKMPRRNTEKLDDYFKDDVSENSKQAKTTGFQKFKSRESILNNGGVEDSSKSFIRRAKKVMFANQPNPKDQRKYSFMSTDRLVHFQRKSLNTSTTSKKIKKGNSMRNISISSRDWSSETDDMLTVISKGTTAENQGKESKVEGKFNDFERRRRKLRERLKFGYDTLLLEADGKLLDFKDDFNAEKEILFQINNKFREKLKVQRKNKYLFYCKMTIKNFINEYIEKENEHLFFTDKDLFNMNKQIILQDYYNEFLKNKYLNVIHDSEILKEKEIKSFPEITIFKNFARDSDKEVLIESFSSNDFKTFKGASNMTTIVNKKCEFNRNNFYSNIFLHKDNVYEDNEDDNETRYNDNEVDINIFKSPFITRSKFRCPERSDGSNSSTKYKKTIKISSPILNPRKLMTKGFARQATRRSLLQNLKEREFSFLSDPNYFKQESAFDYKKRRVKRTRT
jgi:hypothetical protein